MSVADPSSAAILAFGSINADLQFRLEHPLEAVETQRAARFSRLSGGKATNVAVIARRLGVPARLYGAVGSDEFARQALGPPDAAGVDLSGVLRVAGGTAVSAILVPPTGRKRIVLAQQANVDISLAQRERLLTQLDRAPDGSVLVVDFEISPRTATAAIGRAQQRGLRVVVDPSFADRVGPDDLRQVDAVTPNEEEALALTGLRRPGPQAIGQAARELARRGVAVVCVKLADGGCLVLERGEFALVPARRVAAVDTTGAGDAFTGAFAVALLMGRPAREAAAWGVAAASLAVTAWGSQPAYPDRATLEAEVGRLPGRTGA